MVLMMLVSLIMNTYKIHRYKQLQRLKLKNLKYPREGYTYNASQDVVYGVRELAYCAYGKEFMQDYDNHISVAPE